MYFGSLLPQLHIFASAPQVSALQAAAVNFTLAPSATSGTDHPCEPP
jgi:hypothetical protein